MSVGGGPALGAAAEAVRPAALAPPWQELPLRGPTKGGRAARWSEELRRGVLYVPHATLVVSLLVLVAVNAWWLREQSAAVDAGRLPFDSASPARPQPGSTTTPWPASRAASRSTVPRPPGAAPEAGTALTGPTAQPPPDTVTVRPGAAAVPGTALTAAPPPATPARGGASHPAPTTAAPGAVPVLLRIDDLGVEAGVLPIAVAPDGSLEVPERVSDVGWFRQGVRPGEPGSAVIVGHVDAASQGPGAFFGLRDLDIGARISVVDDRGVGQDFEVVARREYLKAELPVASLFGRGGLAVLTLITCGGAFDPQTRSYESNIVVHAVPVAAAGETLS